MDEVKQPLTHRQRQALATRQLILETAADLFLQQGYGVTTIDAISQQAGVAVSTVYALYKSKRGILKAIRESWHGESGMRDLLHQALQEPEPARRLEQAAHFTRRQWETGARLIAIYQSAAAVDPEAAAEFALALAGRRQNLTGFIQQSAPLLRSGLEPDRAAAIFLSLTQAEIYQQLVNVSGWTADEYEAWLGNCLKQQLLG